jgi:hypothetical protein
VVVPVTVPGKTSHAAMRAHTFRAGGLGASVAVNAIDKGVAMFQAIRALEDEWGQTKHHPLFPPGRFTLHPGVVTCGPKGVPVPFFISEFITIEYCCWYHPDEDPEDVGREVEDQDATYLNLGGVPAVSYGPGDLRVAHADDEHCLIDELVVSCKTYAILAMEWCGVASGRA